MVVVVEVVVVVVVAVAAAAAAAAAEVHGEFRMIGPRMNYCTNQLPPLPYATLRESQPKDPAHFARKAAEVSDQTLPGALHGLTLEFIETTPAYWRLLTVPTYPKVPLLRNSHVISLYRLVTPKMRLRDQNFFAAAATPRCIGW